MIQAGIIGISGFGSVHYNDLMRLHQRGEVQLVCATVINQEEEAEKCRELVKIGCRLYTDYQEMLTDFSGRLDLCCIPTGISLHAPMAAAALHSGCHVFLEKPATAVIEDLEALQQTERETGGRVFVGFQHIYQPEIQQIKQVILSGRLGRLKTIRCAGLWPRNSRYYSRNRWAARIRQGESWVLDSPANNALAHYLNLSCFLAGESFSRTADLQLLKAQLYRTNPEIENFDTAFLNLFTGNGVEIDYYVTHSSRITKGPDIRICCEEGMVEWSADQTVFHYPGEKTEFVKNSQDTAMRDHIYEAVLDHLQNPGSEKLVCGLDIARAQTLSVNGAQTCASVVPVSAAEIEKVTTEDGACRYVWTKVDDMMERLYEEGGMPGRQDSVAIVSSGELSLGNYHSFHLHPASELLQ